VINIELYISSQRALVLSFNYEEILQAQGHFVPVSTVLEVVKEKMGLADLVPDPARSSDSCTVVLPYPLSGRARIRLG
jgi:hypothetical protein